MTKQRKILIGGISALVLVVIIIVTILNRGIKFNGEITDKVLKKTSTPSTLLDYSTIPLTTEFGSGDFGIICGSTKIYLGQVINLNNYTEINTYTKEDVEIKHLRAPSKMYDLVVIPIDRGWVVQRIRTNHPDVKTIRGVQVLDTNKEVKALLKDMPGGKHSTMYHDNLNFTLEFMLDTLVEINLSVGDE